AYNVFLLRQFFMTLPRELDEAAMIDGASPLQVLVRIIIPQSWAAIVAVGLFHFVFAWNDYFNPLIYLLGKPDLQVISVGVQIFNYQYGPRPQLVQATSLMALVLPLIIFFFAQKTFMRGVVITGVEK
ncbi:MAG: carbohydrate ABC transporter permease, partial [Anaerolineae bacterium]|nr:carbohydrate ABC transporter permease [Anaerolineae bacterium]